MDEEYVGEIDEDDVDEELQIVDTIIDTEEEEEEVMKDKEEEAEEEEEDCKPIDMEDTVSEEVEREETWFALEANKSCLIMEDDVHGEGNVNEIGNGETDWNMVPLASWLFSVASGKGVTVCPSFLFTIDAVIDCLLTTCLFTDVSNPRFLTRVDRVLPTTIGDMFVTGCGDCSEDVEVDMVTTD